MGLEQILGSAPATTLAGAINNAVTTFSITSGTGWPTGSPGPFVATIDRGLATEEKILVTSRSGTSLSGITRAYDGSTAQAHANLAVIEHTLSAVMLAEVNRIANEQIAVALYAAGTTVANSSKVTGEGNPRYVRDAAGKMTWGPGSGAVDVQLQRLQADMLELQDEMRFLRATNVQVISARVSGDSVDRFNVDASGKQQWGSGAGAVDTNLYRVSADKLKTDDAFEVAGGFTALGTAVVTGLMTASNFRSGTGSPEGVVTAPVGTVFERTDGGVSTALYIKETGAGNTGWAPLVTTPTRLLYKNFADVASSTVGNQDLGSTTVAANLCQTGDVIRVTAWGEAFKTGSLGGGFSSRLKIGTTVYFSDSSPQNISPGSNYRWYVVFNIGFVTQSSQRMFGIQDWMGATTSLNPDLGTQAGSDVATENFSTSKTLAMVASITAGDGVTTVTEKGMLVERLVS